MARNVLVTGGGTGIGRAVAARFAAAGDAVVITGRRPAPLTAVAEAIGATAIPCDHTDPEQLAELVAQLPGRVDVLVNNAGGNTDIGGPEVKDLASFATAFRTQLDANLVSAALTTYALDGKLASGGAVVSIGSIAADKGAGSYGAAKAGLASWNVSVAGELGPRGITANVVSPGYVEDTEFFGDVMTAERRAALVEAAAVRRPGNPDDIAGLIAYLASPDARFVTGQVINANGGAWPTR